MPEVLVLVLGSMIDLLNISLTITFHYLSPKSRISQLKVRIIFNIIMVGSRVALASCTF